MVSIAEMLSKMESSRRTICSIGFLVVSNLDSFSKIKLFASEFEIFDNAITLSPFFLNLEAFRLEASPRFLIRLFLRFVVAVTSDDSMDVIYLNYLAAL